jgi:AraC-like DNA-binding protein
MNNPPTKTNKRTKIERHDYVAGPQERTWGLHVVGVGRSMDVHTQLNDPGVPFRWFGGRTLPCYGLIYLTGGSGRFAVHGRKRMPVEAGDVLFLFPQMWHNYSPDAQTGWSECWILFDGQLPGQWAGSGWLDPAKPVLRAGVHSNLVELFDQLLATARGNPPYVNQIMSGLAVQLVASVLSCMMASKSNPNMEMVALVRRAEQMIEHQWDRPLDLPKLADSIGLNYRTFRHLFQRFAGVSPLQYQLNVRINRAKPMLEQRMPIEQVASRTGFVDPYYFSRLFKRKTGLSPGKWRL